MTPLVDLHCHLLASLDDGPASMDDAIAMCRIAWNEGIRLVAATAHMGQQWPAVTAARIRADTRRLASELSRIGLPLSVHPSAEIALRPDLDDAWNRGELLSVADREAYLLIELPAGVLLDLRDVVRRLLACGVRPILAHPERHPELLHDPGAIEALIHRGCLVQVSSESIASPADAKEARALKRWVRRGIIHLIGSDGHSPQARPPRMSAAYRQIGAWAGRAVADRICSLHGLAVLEGRPLRLPPPKPLRRKWFSLFR
jgi:protein-tyrosine phosphatase